MDYGAAFVDRPPSPAQSVGWSVGRSPRRRSRATTRSIICCRPWAAFADLPPPPARSFDRAVARRRSCYERTRVFLISTALFFRDPLRFCRRVDLRTIAMIPEQLTISGITLHTSHHLFFLLQQLIATASAQTEGTAGPQTRDHAARQPPPRLCVPGVSDGNSSPGYTCCALPVSRVLAVVRCLIRKPLTYPRINFTLGWVLKSSYGWTSSFWKA